MTKIDVDDIRAAATRDLNRRLTIVKLLPAGLERVLNGQVGMTFIVDKFIDTIDNRGRIAHVIDYRYKGEHRYQIWSIGPEGYEIVVQGRPNVPRWD